MEEKNNLCYYIFRSSIMNLERKSGILLHPTSLADSYGIGTIGKSAYKFIDWLVKANQSLWQILPLGPTGYGDSPYASFSTFAGNPLLIDLDLLVEKGWAKKSSIKAPDYIKKNGPVDFGAVVWWKIPVLKDSALYFLENAPEEDLKSFKRFCKEKSDWLDKFASFMSIKSYYDLKSQEENVTSSMWNQYWPKELACCDEAAVQNWNKNHSQDILVYKVIQFFFDFQWAELKKYANENGISLIGDIPIFVAPDSADVWANQKYFQLEEDGRLKSLAGVPPDYFSADGQLWGNPLYDWDAMKKSCYDWWVKRIKRVFELTDILRIDHFRGFEAYWSVPAGEKTAINGKWIKGPGMDLFKTIRKKCGDLPIIAEDLGVITDEVKELRDMAGLPGMKVLQFAFSSGEIEEKGMTNYFMPHMFDTDNCVVYTGTHDNDTLQGWLENCQDSLLITLANYFMGKAHSLEQAKSLCVSGKLRWAMIRSAFSSVAKIAIIPMQDIIGIDNEGRMNKPSTTGANWVWRMNPNDLKEKAAVELSSMSKLYGRNFSKN